jgi:hypothetical protein
LRLAGKRKRNESFRGQIAFVIEGHAKFCQRADFAISSVLKTGGLARNSPEKYLHLKKNAGNRNLNLGRRYFLFAGFLPNFFSRLAHFKVASSSQI